MTDTIDGGGNPAAPTCPHCGWATAAHGCCENPECEPETPQAIPERICPGCRGYGRENSCGECGRYPYKRPPTWRELSEGRTRSGPVIEGAAAKVPPFGKQMDADKAAELTESGLSPSASGEHEPPTLNLDQTQSQHWYWIGCPCGWETGRKAAMPGGPDYAQEAAMREYVIHAYNAVKDQRDALRRALEAEARRYGSKDGGLIQRCTVGAMLRKILREAPDA